MAPDPRGLARLLRAIAEHEPLNETVTQIEGMTQEDVRVALRALADELWGADSGGASATQAAKRVIVNTDGASRGNPGLAGAGWVIYDESGTLLERGGLFLGRRTNNEAEYAAVVGALEVASSMGASALTLRADSELLIRQLEGRYRVKNARLKPLYDGVKKLLARFDSVTLQHVPRADNAEADAEANRAIDERT